MLKVLESGFCKFVIRSKYILVWCYFDLSGMKTENFLKDKICKQSDMHDLSLCSVQEEKFFLLIQL